MAPESTFGDSESPEALREKIRSNIERNKRSADQVLARLATQERIKKEKDSGMNIVTQTLIEQARQDNLEDALEDIEKATRKGKKSDAVIGIPYLLYPLGLMKITDTARKNIEGFTPEDIENSIGFEVFRDAVEKMGGKILRVLPHPKYQVVVDFDPDASF